MVTARPLKVGLQLTTWEGGFGGVTPRWTDVTALARQAEDAGFDSLWVVDHALTLDSEFYTGIGRAVPPELTDETPRGYWDGWTLLTALAVATNRIELGTLVVCTNYRNPAHLAKMADTLDEISGGRLILGLGAGDSMFEHRTLGYPADRLVSRFEEALTIIRRSFRDGAVDFAGTFYRVEGFDLRPRGPRPGGPPILLGTLATKPRMLKLTARYADVWNGWVSFGRSHADVVPPMRLRLDEACLAEGRDPASLERSLAIQVAAPGRRISGSEPITGSAEAIAGSLRALAAEGIGHVQITLVPTTLEMVAGFGAVFDLLDGT